MAKDYDDWSARLGTKALDPIQVLEMQDAIRQHKKRAIVDGVEFSIKYLPNNRIYYRPDGRDEGRFVPAGYLDLNKFMEKL